MQDPRLSQLAKVLVHHSCRVGKGDNVLIDVFGPDHDLVRVLIPEIRAAGGYPFVQLHHSAWMRAMLLDTDEEHMKSLGDIGLYQMKRMDCYLGIRGGQNISELSDVPADHMKWYTEHFVRPVHLGYRAVHTRWVLLRYPDPSMAQLANMSTEAFEDFYFRVCTLDYGRMAKAMEPLVKRMEQAKEVRIVGPGTDLTFSIEGMPVIPCSGQRNIPDGEVSTVPVRDSVNGTITFNTPTVYHGVYFENIRLRFVDGKIVEAMANDTKRLNEILDTDEGARYIGEFSLGLHPRYPLRRKDRRQFPLHAGKCSRGLRQRQPFGDSLGHGLHPTGGLRRRGNQFRRRTGPQKRPFRRTGLRTAQPRKSGHFRIKWFQISLIGKMLVDLKGTTSML